MNLRIKYLGKLDKIINQLKNKNINLQLINDQWIIKTYKMDQLIFKFPFQKNIMNKIFLFLVIIFLLIN
jgi:hypothetical protein